MDKMLNAEQVAGIVGCCESTAYALMRKMPHFSPPGRGERKLIRVWQSDLLTFIAQNTINPAAPQKGGRKPAPRMSSNVLDPELFEPDGRLKRRRA